MAASDDGYANLKMLLASINDIARAAMADTMSIAKDLCKQTTAFQDRTGNLRRSINAGTLPSEGTVVVGALSAGYPEHGDTEIYAGLVELGHGGPAPAGPHPYIEPTMQYVGSVNELGKQFLRNLAAKLGA